MRGTVAGKDHTSNKRPLALVIIVPRAGREAGSSVLNVIVDIAKDEYPYVGERTAMPPNDEDNKGGGGD